MCIRDSNGIEAIIELSLVAGTKVPLRLTIFPLSTYPSNKIDTAGPNAIDSSMFKVLPSEIDFISKISKRIPDCSISRCPRPSAQNCVTPIKPGF